MLNFKKFELNDKPLIDGYFYKYGENSCQHSFTACYCMSGKYGDEFCEAYDHLIVRRKNKCTDDQMEYLFPSGAPENSAGLKKAIGLILEESAGKKVSFGNITESAAKKLDLLFPGKFKLTENRDYFEYIYTSEKLIDLPGHELASKRYDLSTFRRDFGGRTEISVITPDDIGEIKSFQNIWLKEKQKDITDVQLELEDQAIRIGLEHYEVLGLSGIIIRIDGKIAGYAYGAPLSSEAFDVIIEKGDRSFKDIYRVLNRELVRVCCGSFQYINREEDVGVPGLRKAKLSYMPDLFIKKYSALSAY